MVSIFVHRDGTTESATSIDRRWLNPASGAILWVDLSAPSIPESLILSDTFSFHPLAVEDAMSALQYPKVEAYDGFLYVVLHGINFQYADKCFATNDVDFFLGSNYLITVHDGTSRTIGDLREFVTRNPRLMADGPVALFHRIVDTMVDHYRPEIDKLEERIDGLESAVFEKPSPDLVREIIHVKRDIADLRRIVTPQRDVVGRLARREFVDISTEMAFRFRDVYDHLVRIADDGLIFQDRITGALDAHLSSVSNRLNEVMKVLTIVSVVFLPLMLLTSMFGMNVPLPHFPGSDATQFWWLLGISVAITVAMLVFFRGKRWL